ncbi:MAG: hypothetical protein GC145_15090 [Caulobacter sp.]|nr:hypothetical protein [Caulobacter sp.]
MATLITLIERHAVSPHDHRYPAGRPSLAVLVLLALLALTAPLIGDRGPALLCVCLMGGAVAAVCFALEGAILWTALAWSLTTAAVGVRLFFFDLYEGPDPTEVLLVAAVVQAGALLLLTAPVWLASWRARLPALLCLLGPAAVILLVCSSWTIVETRQSAAIATIDLLALPLAALARRQAFRERFPDSSDL